VDVIDGDEVVVGEIVKVTLNVVGTTVVIWMSRLAERVVVVMVAEAVVAERDTEGLAVVELEDWARTCGSKEERIRQNFRSHIARRRR